jgi:hypothetical protein
MKIGRAGLCIITRCCLWGIQSAASAQTKVGDTKDACDGDDTVTFRRIVEKVDRLHPVE